MRAVLTFEHNQLLHTIKFAILITCTCQIVMCEFMKLGNTDGVIRSGVINIFLEAHEIDQNV